MQIVIDIPEEKYEEYKRIGDSRDILFEAIRKGIPLPENHGRLIDADMLRKNWFFGGREKIEIDAAPTIIPATGNEFFNFDAPIIKKQTATKEEKSCLDCLYYPNTSVCESCEGYSNYILKEGDGE